MKATIHIIGVLTGLLFSFSSLNAQTPNESVSAKLSKELSAAYRKGIFEGTIIIASKGKAVIKSSYGFSNRKSKVPNSAETISDIGSIAKTFTAAAILQLVSEGKLKLSTTIGEILPNAPSEKRSITINGLLSHQSGFENYHTDNDFDDMTKSEALEKIFALSLLAKEGEKVAYSNAAYTLLAAIVEEVTSIPFQEYVHKSLLAPLGLKNTGFYGDSSLSKKTIARGYGGSDSGETTFEKGLSWALIGQGGMVASGNDLYQWFSALLNGRVFPGNSKNLALMKANEKWLLGNIRHFDSWGALSYVAGGSTDYGYTSLVQYLPESDTVIVLLLNSYGRKYRNATHQKLSKHHIIPLLL
ncbi:serine hydrolase [Pleionea sp. CnH1-48]|uniref:serine hydrolase domain-containing protein n=1 Tax=Pleionea sp. CnH1-48 TaxID=2954494 RepID=UPI0020976935|nr:serine hydrolase domain-containing protein [Pleionea sp. CnH1-48]MCO7225906.1 beta-lactamase family protein [Pleionea sp. CnH1-48]